MKQIGQDFYLEGICKNGEIQKYVFYSHTWELKALYISKV